LDCEIVKVCQSFAKAYVPELRRFAGHASSRHGLHLQEIYGLFYCRIGNSI
jgi:hypothetical protein